MEIGIGKGMGMGMRMGMGMGQELCGFAGEVITKYGQPAKLAKNRVEGCPCAYNFGIESSVRLVLPILVPIIAGGA